PSAAALARRARRITVKVGSSLLFDGDGLRRDWLIGLGDDLASLRDGGAQLVVVSSGAVALGRKHLGLSRSARLEIKQAAAAAGPAHGEGVGSGGMRTKLEAARIAGRFGCTTIITSGQSEHPIRSLLDGSARLTVIAAQGSPASAYKQWIAAALAPTGQLAID